MCQCEISSSVKAHNLIICGNGWIRELFDLIWVYVSEPVQWCQVEEFQKMDAWY